MEKTNKKVNIQITGILNVIVFLAFFLAKIFDKIDWSWWWVFSPLWIPFALFFGVLIVFGLAYILILGIDKWM